MKKVMLITLMILAVGAFAVAQIQAPTLTSWALT